MEIPDDLINTNLSMLNRCMIFAFLIILSNSLKGQKAFFSAPLDISDGSVHGISSMDVADFNHDGLMDVAVMEGGAHSQGRGTLAWFEQKADRRWIRHELSDTKMFDDFIGSARCGDINNDGNTDLVLTNDGHTSGPINVYIFKNPGKKKASGHWPYQIVSAIDGFHANDMRLADIDANGKLDIIIRHKNPEAVEVIFQLEKDEWQTVTAWEGQAGEGLAVGDLNGDFLPDISLTGHWLKTPKNPILEKFERFDIEANYKLVNKATKEEIGDINGDSRPDVVLSPAEHFPKYGGDDYDLAWYECPENPESVNEWKKHVIRSKVNKAHCCKLADFDNDGDLDLLSAIDWDDLEIRIYFNEKGTFENSILVVFGKGVYSGAVADMDKDGDIDIIGEDKYSNDSRPWFYENLTVK